MQPIPPAGVATRAGLITGLFVGVLALPFITLLRLSGASGLGLVFLFIALVAYAIAGFIATRRSGLLRSGLGAGALAAAITLFIAICLGIVILALLSPRLAFGPAAPVVPARGPVARALARRMALFGLTLLFSLITLALGVVGGFLGGLLGRMGRPRQPAAPQYGSAGPIGPAPQFANSAPLVTPPPFAPGPQAYATDPGGPAPYFAPPPYDASAGPTVTDPTPPQ